MFLSKPRLQGMMLLTRHPSRKEYGDYPILPRAKSEISCLFWIVPPIRRPGGKFKTRVVVVDQYGNEHVSDRFTFQGISSRGTTVPLRETAAPDTER